MFFFVLFICCCLLLLVNGESRSVGGAFVTTLVAIGVKGSPIASSGVIASSSTIHFVMSVRSVYFS